MSLTLLAWLIGYAVFAALAFYRPIWGIALYFLSYFGDPASWWWGRPIVSVRWNLIAGFIALAAVLIHNRPFFDRHRTDWTSILMLGITVNATLVHFLLAPKLEISAGPYDLLLKFVLLFFLAKAAVIDRNDFMILIMIFIVAMGHIGYEAKVNEAGTMIGGRLENIGPPSANTSNQLGSLYATILPLFGAALFCANKWQKVIILLSAPFSVNILLLTNSRGALLSALLSIPVFLSLSPPKARRIALWIVILGSGCAYSLMGDERILERFMTTFADEEERDRSAASRLEYWQAGLRMVQDYPLGAGGDGYKRVHASHYLAQRGIIKDERAVHNGWINEACQWGVQGLLLRTMLIGYATLLAVRRSRQLSKAGRPKDALMGAAFISGMAAFCVSSVFGDVLDNEWGYWMVAMIAAYDRVFASVSREETQLYRLVAVQQVPAPAPIHPHQTQPV